MLLCLSASPLQVPTCLPCRSGEGMGGSHKVKPGDPEWRWMNGRMADLLLQFSYEFCLCSVWVLVDHVYQKSLRNGELDPRFIPFHSAFAPFCWQLVVPLGMQHWPTGQPSSSPPPASVGVTQSRRDGPCGHEEDWAHSHVLVWTCRLKHALDSRLETAWNSNYLRLLPTCRFSFSSYWYCVSSRISKYSFPRAYAVYSDLSLSIDLYE